MSKSKPENKKANGAQEQAHAVKTIYIDPSDRKPGEKKYKEMTVEEKRAALKDAVKAVFDLFEKPEFQELLKDAEERERRLLPYVEKVLSEPKNRRKYKGITPQAVLENLNIMGRVVDPEEITAEILKKAQQKKRAQEAHEIQKEKRAQVQEQEKAGAAIKYASGETLQTTGTKLANEFYSIAPPFTEIDGQLTLNTIYANKAGHDIAVYSYFNFNEGELKRYGITRRQFTDYDYFVAMVCNNLYLENNKQVSLTKIWHEMGNPKSPNPKQLQELREALILGATTILHISNKEVLDHYKIDTETYSDIASPVIPAQIKTDYSRANGSIMNATVYINALSPFILVADPLNQISTWDKQVLKLYDGSRSARYWRVMRYLMQQIAWIRNDPSRSNKITIEHLCATVGDKTRADKQRTLKLTYELLDKVFKPLDYVSSYKTDNKDGGIILNYNKDRKPKLNPENPKNQK